MRIAPAITLSEEQRERLQTWARSRSLPRRLVERAEMILLASEGRQNKAIALTLRRGRSVVARWRQRFIESGLAALRKMRRDRDESQNSRRRGCRRSYGRPRRRRLPTPRTGAREVWRGRRE